MMFKLIPGILKKHYMVFMAWINDENALKQQCVINYKDRLEAARDSVTKKEVNFIQIKDFLYMFTLLDTDGDGLLTLEELIDAFHPSFSVQFIEEAFEKYDDNHSGKMNVEEFLNWMLPSDYTMTREIIETHAASYIQNHCMKKRAEKREKQKHRLL